MTWAQAWRFSLISTVIFFMVKYGFPLMRDFVQSSKVSYSTVQSREVSSSTGQSPTGDSSKFHFEGPTPIKGVQPISVLFVQDGIAAIIRGDYATAFRLLRPLADQGNGAAQNLVGTMYGNGWGVAENDAEALKWFRKAADQGNADAQYSLGQIYQNGWGVQKDFAEAKKWYLRAANQGNPAARSAIAR
jgi:hypothetical protein